MQKRMWVSVVVCLIAVMAVAAPAAAVDAPRWVAALFIEAQKSVGLRWSPVPGATGYKVLRSETKGSGYAEVAAPAVPQHFDATAEPGSTYFYVLQAVAGGETSPNSEERSVAIPGQKKQAILPPEWDKVTQQASTEFGKTSHKVGLFWKKAANVVAYNVYRSEVAGKDYALVGSISEDRYTDAAVQEDKTYYYVLTALDNSFQESAYSPEQSVKIEKPAASTKKEKPKAVQNKIVVRRSKEVLLIPLPEDKQLTNLFSFAYHRDEDKIYVIDGLELKIVIFDSDGRRIGEFGEQGLSAGKFRYPTDVAVNPDGDLLVTDAQRAKVMLFSPKGDFKREFAVAKKLNEKDAQPIPNSACQIGDEIFVSDQENGRIYVYDPKGTFLRGFGEKAVKGKTDLGTLGLPSQLMADDKGNLMVREYGQGRVQAFAPDGTSLWQIGENVKGLVGSFVKVGRPLYFAPGKELIIPDNAMGNIQAFDLETRAYKYTVTGPEGKLAYNERADWGYSNTSQLDYDNKGRLWVSMNERNKIAVLQFIE